ncbi:MAG TPA: hypothetical protein VN903_25570 [Polyangia bacterium]|nr:hypothetical protein [Polyangia bacterium]
MNIPLFAALVGIIIALGTAAWGALKLAAKAGVLIEAIGEMRASLGKWMERVQKLESWREHELGRREGETGRHRMPVEDR